MIMFRRVGEQYLHLYTISPGQSFLPLVLFICTIQPLVIIYVFSSGRRKATFQVCLVALIAAHVLG